VAAVSTPPPIFGRWKTMSETLPAPRVVAPELDGIARLGRWLAASEVESPNEEQRGAAAALRIYFARELGLSPLAASELSIIRGRLVVSAKLIRARAASYGFRVERDDTSNETKCIARLLDRHSGEIIGESTFTMEDAKRAGLVRDKGGWKTYPARMLWARASKFVVDDFAPEVSLGLILEDEAVEIVGEVLAEEEPEPEPEPGPEPEPEPGPPDPSAGFTRTATSYEPEDEIGQAQFVAPEGPRGGGGAYGRD
jgi:hypothetical protein